jgi:hypothetical protein
MRAVIPDKPSFLFASAELRPRSYVQEGKQVMEWACGFDEFFFQQVGFSRLRRWRRLFRAVQRIILERGRSIGQAMGQIHRQARLPARCNSEFDYTPGDIAGVV